MSSFEHPNLEPEKPVPILPDVADVHAKPPVVSPDPLQPVFAPLVAPLAEDPVWNIWDVLIIALLTVVSLIVFQFSVLFVARWWFYPHASLAELAMKPILLIVSQFLIYLPVAACMVVLIESKYHVRFWRAIGWNWPRVKWNLLLLGAATLLVLTMLESVLPLPQNTPFEQLFDRPRDAYLLALIATTLGPLMEELFFRGLFYPVVARRLGVTWGIVLTALPFAVLHLQQYGWAWSAGLIIFLVGVVFGIVRAVTKSVGASFLVHVGYNGMEMVIAIVATRGFTHMPKA